MFDKLVRLQACIAQLLSFSSEQSRLEGQDPSNLKLRKTSSLQQASCNIVEFDEKGGMEGGRGGSAGAEGNARSRERGAQGVVS